MPYSVGTLFNFTQFQVSPNGFLLAVPSKNTVYPGETISVNITNESGLSPSGDYRIILETSPEQAMVIGYVSGSSGPVAFLGDIVSPYVGQTLGLGVLMNSSGTWYRRSYPNDITIGEQNSSPTLVLNSYSPTGAIASGSNIALNMTVNDSDAGDSLSLYIDNVSQGAINRGTVNKVYKLIPGSHTLKVYDGKAYSGVANLQLNTLTEYNISLTATPIKERADNNSLVKKFSEFFINGLKAGATTVITCKYGSINLENSATLPVNESIVNRDIRELVPALSSGNYYQLSVSSSYTNSGLAQTATTQSDVYQYPNIVTAADLFKNGETYLIQPSETSTGTSFNDELYFKIGGIDNSNAQSSQIDHINVYVGTDGSYELVQSDISGSSLNEYIGYNIPLDGKVADGSLFDVKIEAVYTSGDTIEIIDDNNRSHYRRITKPGFNSSIIYSDLPQAVAVNNITNNWNLRIPAPYSDAKKPGDSNYTINDFLLFAGNLEIALSDGRTYTIEINEGNLAYTALSDYGILSIPPATLREVFSSYTSSNNSYTGTLSIKATDNFDNEVKQDFRIVTNDGKTVDTLTFSFGSAPILNEDYAATMDIKVEVSSDTGLVPLDLTKTGEALNYNKNMVNKTDQITFVFGPASDNNNPDNGVNHGDIASYRIKYQQKNSIEELNSNITSYKLLKEIPVNDAELSFNGSVYNYVLRDGSLLYYDADFKDKLSSFVKFGIVACDTTGLESDLVEFDYIIQLGRTSDAAGRIVSYRKESTVDNKINYKLYLNISDIGGNLFADSRYKYSDYPNLERNISTVEDSRGIEFDVYYKVTEDDGFILINKADYSYVIETIGGEYNSSIPYSSIINKNIIFNIPLDKSIVSEDDVVFFEIRMSVKIKTDATGNSYRITRFPAYAIYPASPSAIFGKNAVGINTPSIQSNSVFEVNTIDSTKNLVRFDSFDDSASIIFDLVSKYIKGITISDSE